MSAFAICYVFLITYNMVYDRCLALAVFYCIYGMSKMGIFMIKNIVIPWFFPGNVYQDFWMRNEMELDYQLVLLDDYFVLINVCVTLYELLVLPANSSNNNIVLFPVVTKKKQMFKYFPRKCHCTMIKS